MSSRVTKADIYNVLTRTDDPTVDRQDRRGMHAVGRALVAISSREHLRHTRLIMDEPCGFAGQESDRGRSMALFYTENGFLTEKQVKWWLAPNSKGVPRICKYWYQLLIIANDKLRHQEERRRKYLPEQIDLFDTDEVVMDRIEAIDTMQRERKHQWISGRNHAFRRQYQRD